MLNAKQIEALIKKPALTDSDIADIIASECPEESGANDVAFIAQLIVDEWKANAHVYDTYGEDGPSDNFCDIF